MTENLRRLFADLRTAYRLARIGRYTLARRNLWYAWVDLRFLLRRKQQPF
jgi:hypothetical protein